MARTTTKKPSTRVAKAAAAPKTTKTTKAVAPKRKPTIPAPEPKLVTQPASKPVFEPIAKPAPKPVEAVVDMAPTSMSPEMKKQELIEKVVDRSDIKKKDAKPVIEAMLEVLGEALADGRELNLQPLGKFKLNRIKDTPNARVIVAKIRQSKNPGGANRGPAFTVSAAE